MPRKFKKYSEKNDGRIKITSVMKPKIKKLYEGGMSAEAIGKKFGVSKMCILYWVSDRVRKTQRSHGKKRYSGYTKTTLKYIQDFVAKKVRLGMVEKTQR